MASPSASVYSPEEITSSIQYAADILHLPNVKEQQMNGLTHFLKGHDLFVNLPTGYGKSMIFHGAPLCIDYLNKLKVSATSSPSPPRSLAIVVAPVTALIRDQIQHLHGLSVPALHLQGPGDGGISSWDQNAEKVKNGDFSILFASPEVLTSGRGKDLLASREVRDKLCGIFIDECHCIAKW